MRGSCPTLRSTNKALAGQASPSSASVSPEPGVREPASATSIVQSDHPHGPTSASFAEVNNTSRTRVLHIAACTKPLQGSGFAAGKGSLFVV